MYDHVSLTLSPKGFIWYELYLISVDNKGHPSSVPKHLYLSVPIQASMGGMGGMGGIDLATAQRTNSEGQA